VESKRTADTSGDDLANGAGLDLDPDVLEPEEARHHLRTALERLAVYEGFDRLIADNVRRAREMMEEAAGYRDQAMNLAGTAGHARIEGDLDVLETDIRAVGEQIQALLEQVATIRSHLASIQGDRPVAGALERATGEVSLAEIPGVRDVELIVQGVAQPAVALSLQRHLQGLDGVSQVSLREFSSGLLRLRMTIGRPLRAEDLSSWGHEPAIAVQSQSGNVVELSID